jgi:hypothetical protein
MQELKKPQELSLSHSDPWTMTRPNDEGKENQKV